MCRAGFLLEALDNEGNLYASASPDVLQRVIPLLVPDFGPLELTDNGETVTVSAQDGRTAGHRLDQRETEALRARGHMDERERRAEQFIARRPFYVPEKSGTRSSARG
jgi:hypothetical protein